MKLARFMEFTKNFVKNHKVISIASAIAIALLLTLTVVLLCGKGDDSTPTYTVVFDSADGSAVLSQRVASGSHAKRPANPVRDGYVFDGWYLDEHRWSFESDTVDKSIVLLARWSEAVTVTFDDGEQITEVSVAKGRPISESLAPDVFGDDFIGWYYGGLRWDFTTPPSSDILLCAAWSTEITVSSVPLGERLASSELLGTLIGASLRPEADANLVLGTADADRAVDLIELMRYMPHLEMALKKYPFIKESLLAYDGGIYNIPIVTRSSLTPSELFADAQIIRELLDGDGSFSANGTDLIVSSSLTYTAMSPDGIYEIALEDGSLIRNTNRSGNIITVMNESAKADGIYGADAVNILRSYIDTAYGGYYGNTRSDLFIGERSAWCTDELVALLRCVKACYRSLGYDSFCGISVPAGDEYSLVSLATTLFGVRQIDSERTSIRLSGNALIYSGSDKDVYRATRAVHCMLSEGLLSLGDGDCAVIKYTGGDGGSSYTNMYSPITVYSEIADESGNMIAMRSTYTSLCDMSSCVFISINTVSADKKQLHAALRLIDILYSDISLGIFD